MTTVLLLWAALTTAQATPRSHRGVVVGDTIVWHSTEPNGHVLTTEQPLGNTHTVVLSPPMDSTTDPQHLAIDGMQIDVADTHRLSPHVRYWTDPRLTDSQRRRLKRLTRSGRHHGVYFMPDGAVADNGGLRVTLTEKGHVSAGASMAAGGLFIALLLAMFALYKGLDRSARRDANQYYIDTELGTDTEPTPSQSTQSPPMP